MYAKVEDNTVVKVNSSVASFNKAALNWSKAQLEANGIYEVVYDNTNLKNNRFYINGAERFTFANDTVTASYTLAAGKALDDFNEVDNEGSALLDDNGNQIVTLGLKSNEKNQIKAQAATLLQSTDWYVIRNAESSTAIPANVSTYRTAVRTKSNEIETSIDGAASVEALEALFTYINTGTEANRVYARPLGEWPILA